MRTKVRTIVGGAYYDEGDYGLVDGYISDQGEVFACVIINKEIIIIPIVHLEILDDDTVIPIPNSDKFPSESEISEMADKYNMGPDYNQKPGFFAAISWVKTWLKERNLL